MGKRGGMCRNPFAGFPRIDKLPWEKILKDEPSDDMQEAMKRLGWERATLAETIADAIRNYCFFGIADISDGIPLGNGTCVDEFWFSVLYLFEVRSWKPETWEHARVLKEVTYDPVLKKRVKHRTVLTNEQLEGMCFDKQFQMMGWDIDNLDYCVQRIKKIRNEVLNREMPRIYAHMRLLRELSLTPDVFPLMFDLDANPEDRRILTEPHSYEEVANLVSLRLQPKQRARKRTLKPPNIVFSSKALKAMISCESIEGPLFEIPYSDASVAVRNSGAGLSD